ncbi:MAG: alpha/beta fold hydrolase [Novosphingobium sp.]|nr:alpha/beta fold hydrolase [Novosphingobium sp.]
MTVFVLVHGGGHGGWCYDKLSPILRSRGHDVFAPSLTGLGDRSHLVSPDVGLDTHIADIVNILFFHDLRDVILAGHSYGGMVITGVADAVPERVRRLVYLDASLPRDGESLVDNAPDMMAFARSDLRVVDEVELVLWPNEDSAVRQGVTDARDAEWMLARLTPQPWKCFSDKLRLRDQDRTSRIPRAIVNCTATLARRQGEQRSRAQQAEHVFEIDTGHDLMITEPHAVADMLLEIANS